jgi:protein-tyrosine phosphatase
MIDLELYGGRRSFVMHVAARAMAFAGMYAALVDVDWKRVRRLVFICKGNICRSPYAVMRAQEFGIDAISYGLDTIDNAPANAAAIRNAAERKLDLSTHQSRRLRLNEFREGDVVMLFEPSHLPVYYDAVSESHYTTTLLGLWAQPRWPYIADPYGKSDRYFQKCFANIDSSIREIASRVQKTRT